MPVNTITQAQLDALKTTLVARFNAGLAMTPDDWKKIAKLIKSDGKSNTYAWLTQFPAFREWVGARQHKAVAEKAYTVPNRRFETTVDVQRTDIEDDTLGHYAVLAESAGQAASDLKNDLVFQALAAGFVSPCYDGQYFFDTDHPVAANEDGSGAVTSVSNMQAGASPMWVLLCTRRAAAPIYLQERIAAEFTAKTNASVSDAVFENDVYSFGSRYRGEAAYGFWQCAYGSKAPLTAANFNLAYADMMKVCGDGGRKLGIVPDTLATGPDNMANAEALLKAVQRANGESNTNYNKVSLIVTPWM